ncbi:MAG: glycosyltransferase family 2 protein [Acidimicrobiales bacterium]
MNITSGVKSVLVGVDWFVLAYFLAINSSYLVLIVLAAVDFTHHLRRIPVGGYEESLANPLAPSISVIMPAYNEEAVIVESVRAVLALRYLRFEVVVVDDGSSDGTFAALDAAFGLVEVPRIVPDAVPTRVPASSVHVPRSGTTPLVVVCKENAGRADALNTGINVSRGDLVCMVDADSILDPDALLFVAKPFLDDPERMVATGGVIRAVNGCRVSLGRVVDVRMPTTWLARIQVVEYLRAFLMGRVGWSKLRTLLLISGAFGLFRRDLVVEVGGLDAGCIGQDMELVVRLHRHLMRAGRPYRIQFVAEPVSWTEVPNTLKTLGSQRRRWSRGLTEVLWKHRAMVGNPRYGRIGLIGLPCYIAFELLAPFVELGGLVAVVAGLAVGAVDLAFAWLFLLVAFAYALILSLASLTIEELSFHRYRRWRDLAVAVTCAIIENVGYRQITSAWAVQGVWAALTRHEQVWGEMTRAGFDTGSEVQEVPEVADAARRGEPLAAEPPT